MAINLRPPSQGIGDTNAQVKALYSYLYQLTEQLNVALESAEKSGSDTLYKAVSGGAKSGKVPAGTAEAYQELKALIIKTATEVTGNVRKLVTEMTEQYRAQSEYGTYEEWLNATITTGADGVLAEWDAENKISTNVADFGEYIATSNVYMRAGIVRHNDDGTVEAGLIIGKDLTKVTIDGNEIITSSNVYSLLTAETLSFWQDGVKFSEVSTHDFFVEKAYIGEVISTIITTDAINAKVAQLAQAEIGKATIKDAQIESLSGNKITAKTISAAQLADDAVQVGGTNLVSLRAETLNRIYSGDYNKDWTETAYCLSGTGLIIRPHPDSDYAGIHMMSAMPLDAGEYTISFWAWSYGEDVQPTVRCNLFNADGSLDWYFYDVAVQSFTPTRYEIPVTIDRQLTADLRFVTWTQFAAGEIYITDVKVERGNKATAWSPHPSDPAGAVRTSYISLEQDKLEIGTGGLLNIKSGAMHVSTGDYVLSLVGDDGDEVVMDIGDDGYTTLKGIHAENIREAVYGYVYHTTATIGSLATLAQHLTRTDARVVEYSMTADEYGKVVFSCYSGSLFINANGHRLPKLFFDMSCSCDVRIYNAILSPGTEQYCAEIYGGRVVFEECWFASGAPCGIYARYAGEVRWYNYRADTTALQGFNMTPVFFAHVGGVIFYSGNIPSGDIGNEHGWIVPGTYVNPIGGSGGSAPAIQTATVTGYLGWISDKHAWSGGVAYQGYTTGKGECYGCIRFDLPTASALVSATLTLRRATGVGKGAPTDVHLYGSGSAFGSKPVLGTLYAERNDAASTGETVSVDVTAAVQALYNGQLAQLVLYEGDGYTLSGKVYSTDYCAWDSATLDVVYQ